MGRPLIGVKVEPQKVEIKLTVKEFLEAERIKEQLSRQFMRDLIASLTPEQQRALPQSLIEENK